MEICIIPQYLVLCLWLEAEIGGNFSLLLNRKKEIWSRSVECSKCHNPPISSCILQDWKKFPSGISQRYLKNNCPSFEASSDRRTTQPSGAVLRLQMPRDHVCYRNQRAIISHDTEILGEKSPVHNDRWKLSSVDSKHNAPHVNYMYM